MTFYFSTLCIKISHNKLFKFLCESIYFGLVGAICMSDPSIYPISFN